MPQNAVVLVGTVAGFAAGVLVSLLVNAAANLIDRRFGAVASAANLAEVDALTAADVARVKAAVIAAAGACTTCRGACRFRAPYSREVTNCPDCLTPPISTASATTSCGVNPGPSNA